ncbi:MAG: sulfatase-like hydrolase/transferase [Planctomycetota bacterium]
MPRLAALLLSIAAACPPGAEAAETRRPPNVIVIVADDLGYADVGFNGSTEIPTPALDGLAAGGVRFTNGYVTFPVCSPSRAGLITGRHQQRFGHERNPIYNPRDDTMGLPLGEKTMADVLSAAGYTSCAIGKWHLGAHEVFHPLARGFDEFFGFLSGGHEYFPDKWTLDGGGFHWQGYQTKLLRNRTRVEETEYLTDALSREAAAYVRRQRDTPFFLYLCYNAPHTPMQAPAEAKARFRHIANKKRRTYAAMVSVMDTGIGRVLDAVSEAGQGEHTLVFFLSDNGGPTANASDNGELRGHKGDVYEGGLRVPFVASWPGVLPAGLRYDQPVSSLDIFATAATQAGAVPHVPAGKPLDGVDLVPFLTGQNQGPPHDALFWRSGDKGAMAVRVGKDKLLQPHESAGAELYDLETDLSEGVDQAVNQQGRAASLRQRWEQWNREMIEPVFLGLRHIKEYRERLRRDGQTD